MDNLELSQLRREYALGKLQEGDLPENPFSLLMTWLDDAKKMGLNDPSAFVLGTANATSQPFQRIVLLKGINETTHSVVFFTNYESNKGKQIAENPQVSILFPWYMMERQVNAIGTIQKVSEEESRTYFYSRPKESQVAALVSKQSSVLKDRKALQDHYDQLLSKYQNTEVPFPNFWGGYRITLSRFEFWQGGEHRLHDRFRYELKNQQWQVNRLSP